MSKLIIQEPPLQVLPSLALAIGLNEAIVLQQLHYLLRDPNFGKRIAEEHWIFNTVEEWRCGYFPFWSIRTIKTVFTNLAKMNLVLTIQPEGRVSRRKYYRINHEELERITDGAIVARLNVQKTSLRNVQESSLPLRTKTTAKTSSKTTEGAFLRKDTDGSFSPKFQYPRSEEEMYQTLQHNAIEPNPDYDGNFFAVMEKSGWRIKGKPVFDWMATYKARLEKTDPANQF